MILLRVFGSGQSIPVNVILDAVCGWLAVLAAIPLFSNLRLSAKIQVSTLFAIGVLLMAYAHSQGGSFSLTHAFSRNTTLLTLIMSVGFQKLLLDIKPLKGNLVMVPMWQVKTVPTGTCFTGYVIHA